MRVSKVKVGKEKILVKNNHFKSQINVGEEMVLMYRTNKEGALVKGKSIINQTTCILPKEKLENFKKSILNKTLVKAITFNNGKINPDKNKRNASVEAVLSCLIFDTKLDRINNVEYQIIFDSLKSKFQKDISIHPKDKEIITFNLVDLLNNFFQNNDITILQPYKDWVNWYIETRSKFLIKSINNNRIEISNEIEDNMSKRKQVLISLEEETLEGREDKYYLPLEHDYNFSSLVDRFKTFVEEWDSKEQYDFNIKVKTALKEHQKTIFGTRETPVNRNDYYLAVYNNEVVKYFERYFPIKKSKRTYTANSIIYYLKASTIKETIRKQIENAIRLNMIQRGKFTHHKLTTSVNSIDLSNIKRQEAFVLNLIDACAFAANNIRNIVDNEQVQDILGKKDFNNSLEKNNLNKELFKLFFESEYGNKNENLWALRGSVQQIRNNIIHYNKEAINEIFNIITFENPIANNNTPYIDTILKVCLLKDLKEIPELIASQLMTGGVLTYYNIDNIKEILVKIKFNLCRSSIPFTPSFKKVFKAGCNYQTNNTHKHYLQTKNYYPKKESNVEKQEEYEARYFLLKLLYNNIFLPEFNDNQFRNIAKNILKEKQKQSSESGSKFENAFREIRAIRDNETIIEYMSYVQSSIIQEQIKKDEKEFKTKEEQRNNFEKYLLDIYVKGFDLFLNKFKDNNLHSIEYQFDSSLTNDQKANTLKSKRSEIISDCKIQDKIININNSTHIAFYIFCKLLDANHLSNLRNEIIKYRQSLNEKNKDFEYIYLLEIIELCLLKADTLTISDEKKIIATEENIKPFIDINDKNELSKFGDLYIQADNETFVIHSPIELLNKYGTRQRLVDLVESNNSFMINQEEFKRWKDFRKEENNDIEKKIKAKENLHKEWVEGKFKAFEEKDNELKITDRAKKYLDLANEIEEYNWLDNKLHFVHLKKLHSLTIEILGRMAGFIALFDRDFIMLDEIRGTDEFKLMGFISFNDLLDNKKKKIDSFNSIMDCPDIKDRKIIKRDNTEIVESDKTNLIKCLDIKREYYRANFFNEKINTFNIRNQIAHFNFLTKKNINYSIIDLINNLRELMDYDRKLKNAVAKSIIDIFDRNGMELRMDFDYSEHKLKVKGIKPKKIYHLGTKKGKYEIATNQVSEEYCEMCKCLLEMKK